MALDSGQARSQHSMHLIKESLSKSGLHFFAKTQPPDTVDSKICVFFQMQTVKQLSCKSEIQDAAEISGD